VTTFILFARWRFLREGYGMWCVDEKDSVFCIVVEDGRVLS
jgi:hypothetical protein